MCAMAKIGAYFQNGTMPGNDKFCQLEAGPWNVTIPGRLEKRDDWAELPKRMKSLKGSAI